LVTEGAFVYPKALLQAGFKFQFPDHASALSALY
jgi:NAD dependent epimerase/dehydratase family enzyme